MPTRMGSADTSYSQPSIRAQIQAKEADIQALAQLTRALDKKVSSPTCLSVHIVVLPHTAPFT